MFLAQENRHIAQQSNFEKIPGAPVAYWVSKNVIKIFENNKLNDYVKAVKGLDTCDNDRFTRIWYEVAFAKISFDKEDTYDTYSHKWYPYCKGGGYSKWYGFMERIVNWENDGVVLRNIRNENGKIKSRPQNVNYYFKEGLTWSTITSYKLSLRYMKNCIFGGGGSAMFCEDNLFYYLGYVNSVVAEYILKILNPTLNFLVGDILSLPIIFENGKKFIIDGLVKNNIDLSKYDWDSFETSWDFEKHPLIMCHLGVTDENGNEVGYIEDAYNEWEFDCNERFNQLKANEEELNRIFIDIYGLQDELVPEVEDKDVTVRKADLQRDIKSLISYAVGCMFGRYSLVEDGLIYAGGDWNEKFESYTATNGELSEYTFRELSHYKHSELSRKFYYLKSEKKKALYCSKVDYDNIIPITDEEYFDDDIVGLFCDWLEKVYGKKTLEQNLDFIANALGNKGNTSREVIRNYFLKDFFKDHCKIYQKRPIYWLFDSGKQNGFKALIYMHRYDENTVGNLRVDYLHRMQDVYEKEIDRMQDTINNSGHSRDVAAANKRKEKLVKQLKECKDYDEKIAHIALARIPIDLDDGVKVNYEKVQTVGSKKYQVLAKI